MIKKHERNSTIVGISNDRFEAFFNEAISAIYMLDPLYKDLCSFQDGLVEDEEIYESLEDLTLKVNDILVIADCFPSVIPANSKYLKKTAYALERFISNVRIIVDSGMYPSNQEVLILKDEIFTVIGGLAYFLLNDFGILEMLDNVMENKSSVDIDEIFASYVKSTGANALEVGCKLSEFHKNYKFRLDLFDEYPEYEQSFEKLMGPDYNLIPDGVLTIEMVKQVIDGDISSASLIEMLTADEEE